MSCLHLVCRILFTFDLINHWPYLVLFPADAESWERITFHGVKPIPRIFPAVAMLPAIVKVKNNPGNNRMNGRHGLDEEGSYWWDYANDTTTALIPPENKPTNQVNCLIKRMSGNYQILGSGVEECGVEDWTCGGGRAGEDDELDDLPNQNPKRSETTTCFRTGKPGA